MKFSILNLLSLVTIVALAIALGCVLLAKDPVISVQSGFDGYSWDLRQKLLNASPVWPAADKNPPLSVRDAIAIADEIVINLDIATQPLNLGNWTFETLNISPLDNRYGDRRERWCYVAQFEGTRMSGHTGPAERVSIMILMDGTVYVGEGAWSNGKLENAVRRVYPGNGG